MLELIDVSKTFNERRPNAYTAVQGVTLSLERGRITAFTGPSGSGKTTLLTLLGGLSRPTSGRVRLDGEDLSALPERFLTRVRRERFGVIFQQFHLIRGLSVLDNVTLPAVPLGQPHAPLVRRAVQWLERLGIAHRRDTVVDVLSGGEQQRVAIARALINDPDILIADEPTAHLDTRLSIEFLEIVAALNDEGKTVLMTSHDPRVVDWPRLHRTVRLRDGRMLAPGED